MPKHCLQERIPTTSSAQETALKRLTTLLLAAGLIFSASADVQAIDFKATGEWLVGFTAGNGQILDKTGLKGGAKHKADHDDVFGAGQRVRLQINAIASEYLSGTLFLEMDSTWGHAGTGGALGADGKIIAIKNAFIDWAVPDTDLKFRMGLHTVWLPNAAGGTAQMKGDAGGITASWQINENVGLTAIWFRPANDNFKGWTDNAGRTREVNYLDNLDMFFLSLPLEFDGVSATPWAMYGLIGKNAIDGYHDVHRDDGKAYEPNNWTGTNGTLNHSLYSLYPGFNLNGTRWLGDTRKAYGSSFWVGLPLKLTLWDPLNIEFDFNYGYVEGMGRYDVMVRNNPGDIRRASSERKGWLAKALVEYKFDWGIPGIFGWYGSGDDGSLGNGSERMPALAPATCFTTFMGDMEYWDWAPTGTLADRSISYAGTWGLGLQIRDMSFIDDLKHTFRVAWWGGTNSPSMVKYMSSAAAWNVGWGTNDGPYLTTNDGILEFNLINSWKIYENFEANLELGYLVNFIDKDTWKRSWMPDTYDKKNAWKAQLIFAYRF